MITLKYGTNPHQRVAAGRSTRDADVEAACREDGIGLVHTHLRLFHH